MGLKKSYVIIRVGHAKILLLLTRWVGGSKKGPKHAYVIFEWSLTKFLVLKLFSRGIMLKVKIGLLPKGLFKYYVSMF